jgi:hypothetical protein
MRALLRPICLGLLAATLWLPALAQRAAGGDGGGQRTQGGGINYAPQPAVYSVTFVDSDARMVRLRAADGRTGVVHVADGVYDLSKLQAGDKIRVDFMVPDSKTSKLSAAAIWPVK